MRHVPPKHRLTFNGIYDVISPKTELFELLMFYLHFEFPLKHLNTVCHGGIGNVHLTREMFPLILKEVEQFVKKKVYWPGDQ
jgi:hypothetical protein